ncbi:MAG: SDR family oxidoreductase, partial [Gammaproteobacteria bacterium]|nr:SDR family oxidoreductase [Gammaproteobacteria bacterium]
MGFLTGKRALIAGLASNRSIAWGIAKAMKEQGAELAFTYQNEKLQGRVEKMADELGSSIVIPCDVSTDQAIGGAYEALSAHWDKYDCLIHSVAFAPKEELVGDYVDMTTRAGFNTAHEISSYSFTAMARIGRSMMQDRNGSLITLSYLGAERAMPNYNVMGLAKASLEANVRYM